MTLTPEQTARQEIDHKLEQAGWSIQDYKRINFGAASGIAVREYPTETGHADYILFVDKKAVGVIEAKRKDEAYRISKVEEQSAASGSLNRLGGWNIPGM